MPPTTRPRYVLLRGGEATTRYETDHEPLFRQESNFAYLFGVKEPDCYACICVDEARPVSTLFVPEYSLEYAVVMGPPRTLESYKTEYGVDQVYHRSSLDDYFPSGAVLLTVKGVNTDSGNESVPAVLPRMERFTVDASPALYLALAEQRAVKNELELGLMAHVNRITCLAHAWVMRHSRPGMMEFQQESLFAHFGLYCGQCRHTSYTSICGSGAHASVLHYGHAAMPNAKMIADGELCLLDMGAELQFYGSDVTCTFPANGVFTPDQRTVYQTVLDAQWAVMERLRPGVYYPDMHTLAYKVILLGLTKAGVLRGNVDDMLACNLGAVFMPHGLGHFLGIDTHDVAGRPPGCDDDVRKGNVDFTLPGYKKLRLRRVLVEGNVLTVEPGLYFIDMLLDKALADPVQCTFIVPEALARFRGSGGVRIEDDVVITKDGVRNLTRCPRTVSDIEAWMRGEIQNLNQLECPWSLAMSEHGAF